MVEFNLSEKICIQRIYNPDGTEALPYDEVLHKDTVKEFIRRVNELLELNGISRVDWSGLRSELDKLAGDKLV